MISNITSLRSLRGSGSVLLVLILQNEVSKPRKPPQSSRRFRAIRRGAMRVTSTWRPRNRETYWYIGSDGKPWPAVWFDDSSINRARMELGNVLRTRQDAERRIASIRARVRLRESAERLNLGWRPNWSDTSEPKWTIVYDHQQKQFLPAWGECEDLDSVYFRTDELARQAIAELGEDLHKVLDYRRSKRREVVKGRLEEIRNPRFSLLMRTLRR